MIRQFNFLTYRYTYRIQNTDSESNRRNLHRMAITKDSVQNFHYEYYVIVTFSISAYKRRGGSNLKCNSGLMEELCDDRERYWDGLTYLALGEG